MVKKSLLKSKKGFTLIELMTVIAIIGILATIAIPNYRRAVIKAEAVQLASTIEIIRTALIDLNNVKGKYPEFFIQMGKVPVQLQGHLPDDLFHGPGTIMISIKTGHPNSRYRSARGFVEENEPFLVLIAKDHRAGGNILLSLQHILGPERLKFVVPFSWAKLKVM